MSSNMEYEIFLSVYGDLQTGICHDLDQLVPKAYENRLIGSDTKEEAQLATRTPPQRAGTLLSAIDNRIRTNPPAFHIFVRVLRSVSSLRYLADRLQQKLIEQPHGQTVPIVSESGAGGSSSSGLSQAVYVPLSSVALPQGTLMLVGSVQYAERNISILDQTSLAENAVRPQSGDMVEGATDSMERNVAQRPADASYQTPPDGAIPPFQKQQSQRQRSLSPPVGTPLQQLKIFRTQPSTDEQEDQTENKRRRHSRCGSVVSLSDSETLPYPKSPLSHSSDSVCDSFKSAYSHLTVSRESIFSEGDSADEVLKRELVQTVEKCKETIDKKRKHVRRLIKKLKQKDIVVTSLQQKCKEAEEQENNDLNVIHSKQRRQLLK